MVNMDGWLRGWIDGWENQHSFRDSTSRSALQYKMLMQFIPRTLWNSASLYLCRIVKMFCRDATTQRHRLHEGAGRKWVTNSNWSSHIAFQWRPLIKRIYTCYLTNPWRPYEEVVFCIAPCDAWFKWCNNNCSWTVYCNWPGKKYACLLCQVGVLLDQTSSFATHLLLFYSPYISTYNHVVGSLLQQKKKCSNGAC